MLDNSSDRLEEYIQSAIEHCPEKEANIHSSPLWRKIFESYYGRPPEGINDPEWDSLFAIGFSLCAEILKRRT